MKVIRLAAIPAILLVAGATAAAASPAHPVRTAHAADASQQVNSAGGLDCNGYSLIQEPVRRGMDCTEIASNSEYGFDDNGHYIGHDEPAAEFFSSKPGSGGS